MEDVAQGMKIPIELFIESKVLPEYRISNVDDFQEEIFRYYKAGDSTGFVEEMKMLMAGASPWGEELRDKEWYD